MAKKLIIIGAGGHGKVIVDIALKNKYDIVGFLDEDATIGSTLGIPILGSIEDVPKYQDSCEFVIAIGSNRIRRRIAEQYDVKWAILIHPAAVIGIDVQIGEGTVIMANAVVSPSTTIGRHCIINTGVVVEHDNILNDYVHISSNATLAGTVTIGISTHIGVGACVKNNIEITGKTTIGAGAVVVKNITERGVYVGVPARRLR